MYSSLSLYWMFDFLVIVTESTVILSLDEETSTTNHVIDLLLEV